MNKIVEVPVGELLPNPYRNIKNYPIIEAKVEALMRSIGAVGMWPSIIARKTPKGWEKAFGHSRQVAAERRKLKTIPVIQMDLTDEQMLQYMGRENGEDYATDVQIMLNTWDAGLKFLKQSKRHHGDVDVARLLGWMEGDDKQMNMTARTCAAAQKLIDGGHMSVAEIEGITVSSAYHVVERVASRLETIQRNIKDEEARETAVKAVVKAGKQTVEAVRGGKVAARDIRSTVDQHTFANTKGTKAEIPLFRAFGKTLTDQIYRTLRSDAIAEKLEQVVEALPQITAEDDLSLVRTIGFDLEELESRSKNWRKKLRGGASVTPLRSIEGRI